uniref:Uncharacterized protein n=1 Tax=Cacopsylla melanoneura TaxID=428564 RepID=A0A8D8SE54_9HEMI
MMLPIFSVGREVTIETTESPLSHGSCTPTSTPFNNGPECTSTPVPPLENDSQSTDGASQGNDSHSTDALVTNIHDVKKLPVNLPNTVKINNIKVMKITKDQPNVLHYKHSYEESDFHAVYLISAANRKKQASNNLTLTPAYASKPGISDSKLEGLLELIKQRHIPEYYSSFYKSLK